MASVFNGFVFKHSPAEQDGAEQHGDVNPFVRLNNGWSEPPAGCRVTSVLRHSCSSGRREERWCDAAVSLRERTRQKGLPARRSGGIIAVMAASWKKLPVHVLLLLTACGHINTSKY